MPARCAAGERQPTATAVRGPAEQALPLPGAPCRKVAPLLPSGAKPPHPPTHIPVQYYPVSNDFMNLIRQVIAAALSAQNLQQGGYQVPANISAALATANQYIGDRLLPTACPVAPPNNGLCGCCATSSCGSGSVCSSQNQGCVQLTGAIFPNISDVTSTLGKWCGRRLVYVCGAARA